MQTLTNSRWKDIQGCEEQFAAIFSPMVDVFLHALIFFVFLLSEMGLIVTESRAWNEILGFESQHNHVGRSRPSPSIYHHCFQLLLTTNLVAKGLIFFCRASYRSTTSLSLSLSLSSIRKWPVEAIRSMFSECDAHSSECPLMEEQRRKHGE